MSEYRVASTAFDRDVQGEKSGQPNVGLISISITMNAQDERCGRIWT